MSGFPAHEFIIEGQPGAIRGSAGQWQTFATEATAAAGQIRSLDTTLFVGPEADTYRSGLTHDLPPHLDVTGAAYGKVAGALNGFAGELSRAQDRMSPLAVRAPALWQAVASHQAALSQAQADDQAHQRAVTAQTAALPAGASPPPDTYQSQTGAAAAGLTGAQQAWNDCLSAARQIKADLAAAVSACSQTIHDASGMRFKSNPHGWGALTAGFHNFVKDHVAGLQKLSGVLKIVSGVCAVLSFVPVIDVVAAPLAVVTGGAALAIDATIKAETGQGSWKSIAVDGALMAVPGIGKLVSRGVRAARGARVETVIAEGAKGAASATGGNVPTVVFSRSRAPGIAGTFDDAVAGGAPTRLNRVTGAARDANRRAALRGHAPAPAGQSLDEYPFASSVQGGAVSVVRPVPIGEQSYQGGVLSRFYQDSGTGVGDPFNVEFGP